MTGIIAIDESGDLGKNGTRFFVISAIITNRSRSLLLTSKLINNNCFEMKYTNSDDKTRKLILKSISESKITVTYIVVDKYDFNSKYYNKYGKELYKAVLFDLVSSISKVSPISSANLMLDRNSAISKDELKNMIDIAMDINITKCEKYNSSSSKCIQIADFIAGAIWHMYERNERANFSIIEKSIRRP